MKKYYESYKILILATVLAGLYMPSVEKIYGSKWYFKILKLLAIIPGFCLGIYFFSYIKFIFFDDEQLWAKVYGLVLLVFAIISLYTFVSFYVKRAEYDKVFELWDSLFHEELFSEGRQELLNKNRKLTIKWLLTFGGPSLAYIFIYCLITCFNPEKKLPHPSGIPYRHASPDFELVATQDLIASLFGFAILIIFDSVIMAIVSQEEAQFIHLKNSLGHIIEIIYVTDSGEVYLKDEENSNVEIVNALDSWKLQRAFQRAEEKFRLWLRQHREIIRYHDEVQRIFADSFSIKYLTFMLFLCCCSFLVITGEMDIKDIAVAAFFCSNVYATFYVNISYADSASDTAESLFDDAFSKAWYLFPKKFQTAFHIILLRCRRPIQYKILHLYPLNPRSFLKVLTTSYTFFTFLLQVYKKY